MALLQALQNATGHGSDIGAAMPSNFSFISNSTQRYSNKFAF